MMSSLQSNRHLPFTNSVQRQQQQQQSQPQTSQSQSLPQHLHHPQHKLLLQQQQVQQQHSQQHQVQQVQSQSTPQQQPGPGAFPQSLSGSETDISTSNENLSHEERYVIRHTARQEPQGQENLALLSSSRSSPNSNRSSLSLSAKLEGQCVTGGSGGTGTGSGSNRSSLNRPDNSSNRSSLDVSSSSYNTLIIHGTLDDSWSGRLSGIRDIQDQGGHGSSPSPSSNSGSVGGGGGGASKDRERERDRSAQWYGHSIREIIDIPDDFLSQSQVLKHLAMDLKGYRPTTMTRQSPDPHQLSHNMSKAQGDAVPSDSLKRLSLEHRGSSGSGSNSGSTSGPCNSVTNQTNSGKEEPLPPPQYPQWGVPPLSNHLKHGVLYPADRMALSRSQPDLSRLGDGKLLSTADIVGLANNRMAARGQDCNEEDRVAPAEMVDMLIHENNFLRHELNECSQKVARSIRLEQEIQKVHRAQEELVASSERRERLERVARARLQADCRRIQIENRALREQVEMLTAGRNMGGPGSAAASDQAANVEALKREVGKREVLIAQLITQNKELSAAKERQEIELAAQRVTLQEQRTHINILDTALTNAQGNVVRLEEECRKKQLYVERVAQLQRALSSLQLASDRREQGERKLRMQLERELRNERARAAGGAADDGGSGGNETAAELKRKLREREGKIMLLEGEVAKWEQRYIEESSMRQAAIDAASLPKDAKIAALEKTSQETEKLIAEARTEKIRHMDEVHAAQKRVTDLESRVKDLESKLAERDAMIRVLQKHTCKEAKVSTSSSYPSISLGRSPHHTPHHTPHASLNTDLGVLGCSVSREELGPVFSTGSPAFNSSNQSYSSSVGESGYHHSASGSYSKFGASQSFDQTKKCLDDELKELDSQLDSKMLSKRGLCCFPGFSNPSSAARKGKVSQPLLAGVGVWQGLVAQSRYEAAAARPEEMLLLEKQGLSSQQQRMPDAMDARSRSGSLPPSSLPRPRRSHGSCRLGEYGRLSDGENTRKTSANSSLDGSADTSCKGRDSLPPTPRKLGEYGRLSDGESGRKSRSCKESPNRSYLPPPRKLSDYGKLSANSSSDGSVDVAAKTRDSPARFLPPPRKLSDSERKLRGSVGSEAGTRDSGTSEDSAGSKLRLIPAPAASVMRTKRSSSLQRDAGKPSHTADTGVRSLPTSNKYRIQF